MQDSPSPFDFKGIGFFSMSNQLSAIKPWIVCLSASLFFFYDFMLMNMFNSINNNISAEFALNATEISRLSALYPMATVSFLLISGLLLDRYSTRRIILTSMALCVLTTSTFALSTTLVQAAISRFIAGATAAFCFLSCVMLASRWFKPKQLAFVTGLIVTMAMTGGSMSQAPLKTLVISYGWRSALFILSAIGLALLSIMFFTIEDRPGEKVWKKSPGKNELSVKDSLLIAAKNPQNWILGLYTSFMNLLICVFGGLWGQAYLSTTYSLDAMSASEITMLIFLGTTIGSPLAGFISDKIGKRKSPMVMGAILSLLLVGMLFINTAPSFQFLSFVFFSLGLTTSAQVISYPAIFESNPPEVTGICESLSAVLIMSGVTLFPLTYGIMLDMNGHSTYTAGDHYFAFLILPITLVISLILALMVKETNCQQQH